MELMPEGWEAQAKALGALQRSREIKTPEDWLRLIVLYPDGREIIWGNLR
ncbi:MAG: hypothetical protein LBT14_08370 [Treponema sp.]|jgi:hypothetical protein|nr:hypothetical protein [Treponema sp.]